MARVGRRQPIQGLVLRHLGTLNDVLADQEPNSGSTGFNFLGFSNTHDGQVFLGDGRSLSRIEFWISRTGSPPGNVTVELYAAGTGTYGTNAKPGVGAVPLATSSTSRVASTLAAAAEWVTFEFAGYTLTNGTPYALVATVSSAADASNHLNVISNVTGTHAGNGVDYRPSGGGWTSTAPDKIFRLYTSDVVGTPAIGSASLSLDGTGVHSSVATASLSLSGANSAVAAPSTATASLSLSGSGVQSSVGSASLNLSGAGVHSSVGTASLSVSGAGVHSSVGTGSLSLSGTGAAQASAVATASVSLSASGVQSSVGSASLSLSGAGGGRGSVDGPAFDALVLRAFGTHVQTGALVLANTFESGLEDWYAGVASTSTVTRDTAESHTGTYSIKVAHGSSVPGVVLANYGVAFAGYALTPPGAYDLSFWFKQTAGPTLNGMQVLVEYTDAVGDSLDGDQGFYTFMPAFTSGWQQLQVRTYAPPDAHHVYLSFVDWQGVATATWRMDDVSFSYATTTGYSGAGVGSGSLSVSAAGSGRASGVATASLSLVADGAASAGASPATGTASLDLSGSGAARAATAGTASVSLAGTGVQSSVGSASLSLSATGAALATAAASASLSLTAANGAVGVARTGTASLSLSGTGAAQAASIATASVSLSGTGTAQVAAVATASLSLSGTGSGQAAGVAAASLSLSGTTSGQASVSATASLTVSATGLASVGPPTGLTVTPVGADTLLLDWDDYPTSILFYEIERDGLVVATSGVSTYTDTPLTTATNYCYRVRAVL